MDPNRLAWIQKTAQEAAAGQHVWPNYAASEAALESNFGTSKLATEGNNLFGQKYRFRCPWGELSFSTKEIINGEEIEVLAHWIAYPDIPTCFGDRMATLKRLRYAYPDYDAALQAATGEEYVRSVSRKWSTDTERADKVLEIYKEYFG